MPAATAKATSCHSGSTAAGAMVGPGDAVSESALVRPAWSVITTTPESPAAWRNSGPGRRARLMPSAAAASTCGALCTTWPQASGANQASRTWVASSPGMRRLSTPSGETAAGQGAERGVAASAAAKRGASADGVGVPAGRVPAGRVRVKSPSSGTQIFSQTSQEAWTWITSRSARAWVVAMVTGRTTSPS